MEPKEDASTMEARQGIELDNAARSILRGFLQGEGVSMGQCTGKVEELERGLQALFSANGLAGETDSDADEEADDEEEKDDSPIFVTETYVRRLRTQEDEPKELELSMASAHHSLWGHKLWNASKVLGEMIEEDPSLVKGKNCLELGAGAGLPSLLAALNGAKHVVVSDYASTTDQVLVEAIQMNIDRLLTSSRMGNNNNSKINIGTDVLSARGYVWGQQIQTLLEPLSSASAAATALAGAASSGFDVIICADLIFNRSEHSKLLWTCKECLVAEGGQVLVAYSHHDPEKAKLDMRFFELAKEEGWVIEDIKIEQCVDLFVENDGLDEERGKVYVKRLMLLPPALNAEQPVETTTMAESKQ